jgi:hypothetical protein
MAGDIKNPDNKKFDKIKTSKENLIKQLEERKRIKNLKKKTPEESAFSNEFGKGSTKDKSGGIAQFKDGGRVAKGCGAILSNKRKKTKYF